MESDWVNGVDTIFFDFDETLIDAPRGLKAAHRALAEELCDYFACGGDGKDEISIAESLSNFDDRMNLKRNYDRDSWWPKFVDEMGLDGKLGEPETKELTRIYWGEYAEAARPYPFTEPVLNYLHDKGYKLGLITDTDGSGIPKMDRIERFSFSGLFDATIVAGKETKESKPDPEPFKLGISKLGSSPERSVMVGDKPFTDIRGARSIGMRTILINRRDWGEDGNPDATIDSLAQLRGLF